MTRTAHQARTHARRATLAIAALTVVAACASGDDAGSDGEQSTASVPSATAAPAVTDAANATTPGTEGPSTTVAVVVFGRDGQAASIEGVGSFGIGAGRETDDGAGGWRVVGAPVVSHIEMNDPRASGEVVEVWNAIGWGGPGPLAQWGGLSVLTNDGGQWVGSYTGTYSPATSDVIMWWYTGRGGYEGLSLVTWITESTSGETHGIVYPGELPPPYTTPADPPGHVIVKVLDLTDMRGGQLAGTLSPVGRDGESDPVDAIGGFAIPVTQSSQSTTQFISGPLDLPDEATSEDLFPYVSGMPAALEPGDYQLRLWAADELQSDRSRWVPTDAEGLRSCVTDVTVTAGEATIIAVHDLPSAEGSTPPDTPCDTTS